MRPGAPIIRYSPTAFLAGAVLLLTACGSISGSAGRRLPTDAEVEAYNASAAPEDQIICRDEVPTGSKIPRRVCRIVGDIEATAAFSQDLLRRMIER